MLHRLCGCACFLLLSLPARLLFTWLNNRAFDAWRCPVHLSDGGKLPAGAGTGLEVIVASAGNSGSTALHASLEALGLRTWGVEDFAFYLDYPFDRLEDVEWAGPRSPFKACGVQAIVADTMLMPVVDTVVPQSPESRVLLLSRQYKSWVASKAKTTARGLQSQALVRIFALLFLCNWLPVGPLWPPGDSVGASVMRQDGNPLDFTAEMLDYCVFPFRVYEKFQSRGFKAFGQRLADIEQKCLASEAGYTEFKEGVRRGAATNPFLEMEVRNATWEVLAAFAGRTAPGRGRLPGAKAGGFGKIVARMGAFPRRHLAFLAFSLLTAALHWAALRALRAACCARRREKAE